jgi:hypothetical protein
VLGTGLDTSYEYFETLECNSQKDWSFKLIINIKLIFVIKDSKTLEK